MGVEIVVPLAFFGTAIILAVGIPLARAFARKMDAESKNTRIPSEVTQRLERMEQTLEAVAIEVERITEGQRFTTKLLSEGRGAGDGRQSQSSSSPPDRAT
jgi:Na+/glutamate symporter